MRTFWTTADLRARGRSAREIRRAAERGDVRLVRPGHFATPSAPPDVVRCVRVGGVATSTTAARAIGLWTPPDTPPEVVPAAFRRAPAPQRLHVAVPATAGRLKDPDDHRLPLAAREDVVVHWTAGSTTRGASATRIAPPLLLLEHAFRGLPPERALTMLDSALHLRHLGVRDLPALADALPERLRPVVFAADACAESGIETIVRYLLRLAGLRVEPQAGIGGVGDVDLLVEGCLVVECDGREWHDDEKGFENDRRRDLVAVTGRYRVLRVTWWRVLFDWPAVEAAVFAALAA